MCTRSKPKFRIFDNWSNPAESFIECCSCGVRCRLDEEVEHVVRAPKQPGEAKEGT